MDFLDIRGELDLRGSLMISVSMHLMINTKRMVMVPMQSARRIRFIVSS